MLRLLDCLVAENFNNWQLARVFDLKPFQVQVLRNNLDAVYRRARMIEHQYRRAI